MRIRKQEYKPLLFTTTVRNPERIKDFIKVIANSTNNISLCYGFTGYVYALEFLSKNCKGYDSR